jgi:hypothetical protein
MSERGRLQADGRSPHSKSRGVSQPPKITASGIS